MQGEMPLWSLNQHFRSIKKQNHHRKLKQDVAVVPDVQVLLCFTQHSTTRWALLGKHVCSFLYATLDSKCLSGGRIRVRYVQLLKSWTGEMEEVAPALPMFRPACCSCVFG